MQRDRGRKGSWREARKTRDKAEGRKHRLNQQTSLGTEKGCTWTPKGRLQLLHLHSEPAFGCNHTQLSYIQADAKQHGYLPCLPQCECPSHCTSCQGLCRAEVSTETTRATKGNTSPVLSDISGCPVTGMFILPALLEELCKFILPSL